MRKSSKLLDLLCKALDHEGYAQKYRREYESLYNSLDNDERAEWEYSDTYKRCLAIYKDKFKEDN